MTFQFDTAFRQTEEYKQLMEFIKKDVPWMPQALAEACIIAHKCTPQAYKADKNHKKVLAEPIKPPKNVGEIVINDAVKIGGLTDDIIKQRNAFWEKHIQQNEMTTIEEVET